MRHFKAQNTLLQKLNIADAFAKWLRENCGQVVAAARLLGGDAFVPRANSIITLLGEKRDFLKGFGELRALRRLLNLDFMDYLDSSKPMLFTAVYPDDPRSDAPRLCAEALDRGVRAIDELVRSGVLVISEAA